MNNVVGPIYRSKKNRDWIYAVEYKVLGFYRVMRYDFQRYPHRDYCTPAGAPRRSRAAAARDLQRIAYQDQNQDKRPLTRLTGISCGTCRDYDAQTWTCMKDGTSGLPPFHHCANWRPQERGDRP